MRLSSFPWASSRELDDLIKTVKFESLHVLTRAELYRFGVDRRPMLETAWTLETAARPYVRKVAAARQGDGASFRTMEWRLFCENKDRARLTFVRESDQGAGSLKTMMLMAGSDKSITFGKYPARVGKFEVWSDVVAPDAMQAILTASHLQMGEGTLGAEGKTTAGDFRYRYRLALAHHGRNSWRRARSTPPGLQRRRPVPAISAARAIPQRLQQFREISAGG